MHRILIVDDEHVVADTLKIIFTKHGFAAEAVYSANEAMAFAPGFDPDILLCDIDMPEKDGVELIAEMNTARPACQILVLTGAYASIQRVRDRASQLERKLEILPKPCAPVDVLRAADALLLAPA